MNMQKKRENKKRSVDSNASDDEPKGANLMKAIKSQIESSLSESERIIEMQGFIKGTRIIE